MPDTTPPPAVGVPVMQGRLGQGIHTLQQQQQKQQQQKQQQQMGGEKAATGCAVCLIVCSPCIACFTALAACLTCGFCCMCCGLCVPDEMDGSVVPSDRPGGGRDAGGIKAWGSNK